MNDSSASTVSPQVALLRMVYGAVTTRLITVAAELGIADLVDDGARPVAELAAETCTGCTAPDPENAGIGVFTERTEELTGRHDSGTRSAQLLRPRQSVCTLLPIQASSSPGVSSETSVWRH